MLIVPQSNEPVFNLFKPNKDNVRTLGRTEYTDFFMTLLESSIESQIISKITFIVINR